MIAIDFIWSIFLFVTAPLLILFFFWFMPFKKSAVYKTLQVEKDTWHCAVCTYAYYVFERNSSISKCPRCGSLSRRAEALISPV